MATESALTDGKQTVNYSASTKRPRGRPPMAEGNRARNRPKGFHVSTDACEMLEQLVYVVGKSESFWVDEGVRQIFMRYKQQYSEAFGADYWDKCLDSCGHIDRLKNRRKVIKTQ